MFVLCLLVPLSTGSPQPRLDDTSHHGQDSIWSKLRAAVTRICQMLQSFWYEPEGDDLSWKNSAAEQNNFSQKGSSNHGCTKFTFAIAGGGGEIIRVRGQIGEIIRGFTPIFRVFGPFFDGIW